MTSSAGLDEYEGTVTIPGEQEPHLASILLDREGKAVTVKLDAPVAGSAEWIGERVQVANRKKYTEVVFATTGRTPPSGKVTAACGGDHISQLREVFGLTNLSP